MTPTKQTYESAFKDFVGVVPPFLRDAFAPLRGAFVAVREPHDSNACNPMIQNALMLVRNEWLRSKARQFVAIETKENPFFEKALREALGRIVPQPGEAPTAPWPPAGAYVRTAEADCCHTVT